MRRVLHWFRVCGTLCALAAPVLAQDAWVSPKERPAAVEIGDRGFEPQGNLRLFDALRVHPSLRQTVTYDDNIFLTDKNAEDDLLSLTSLGLRCDLLPGNFEITAGTRFRWEQYFDHSKESHSDWISEFRANYIGRTLKVEFGATLQQVEEPLNQVLARRLERVVGTVTAAVRTELNRFGFDIELGDENWDFRKPFGSLDHHEARGALALRFLWAEESTVFLQYIFGLVDYFRDFRSDYTTHEVLAGWRGKLGAKLEGEVAAGWLAQTIDEATGATANDAHRGPIGRAQLAWTPTPRLTTTVRYRSGVQFGQLTDYQRVDRGELSCEWRPEYEIVLRGYGFVENNDPPGLPPFLNCAVGTTADWDAFVWLSVGAGIEYRWRLTDIPDAEYQNLRVWVHLTMYL